jgi:hypothetical protein
MNESFKDQKINIQTGEQNIETENPKFTIQDESKISINLSKVKDSVSDAISSFNKLFPSKQKIEPEKIFSGEFLAKEELEKITSEPRTSKLLLLKEFKQKLATQQRGLASAQVELITEIKKSPDLPISELYNKFIKATSKFGLNHEQKEIAMDILNAYSSKREKIKMLREKYPEVNDLFEFLFKHKPVGQIELIEGPISLYFKCSNLDDYLRIYYSQSPKNLEKLDNPGDINKLLITNNTTTLGVNISHMDSFPGLEGVIMAENSSRKESSKMSQEIFNHEEQHSINAFFKEKFREREVILRLETAESEEEKRLALINLLDYRREFIADEAGKNELLAFLKAGSKNLRDMKNILLGTNYDFIKGGTTIYPDSSVNKENDVIMRKALSILDNKFSELQPEFRKKYYDDKYKNNIINGIKSIRKLQSIGYNNDEIIALLSHEPLQKWIRVVNRISTIK